MAESKELNEGQVAHGEVTVDLKVPVILELDGQPVAVVLSYEEYCRLRDLAERARARAGSPGHEVAGLQSGA
ncbi:MAG: hypothetical protein ISS50_01795 [Anaerolineae bacterium]|nr:hypothetical protein [Anaerolineae bacterium]